MVGDESRRFHAIQVLEGIEPFVSARISVLSIEERNKLTFHLALLLDNLEYLSPDARAQTGSDQIKASILRAKERIVKYNTT